MNKKSLFSLVFFLLLLSLACNFPLSNSIGGVDIEGDPDDAIAQWQVDDVEMGEFLHFDMDLDGDDGFYYDFPREVLLEGVTLQEIAIMDNEAGVDYRRYWMYRMWNENPQDMSFELVVELPKEFAVNANDIEFTTPPMEIIDPDPKLRFGFTLKADSPPDSVLEAYAKGGDVSQGEDVDSIFGQMVIPTAVEKCIKKVEKEFEGWTKAWIQNEKDKCRFNAAADFTGVVDSAQLDKLCDDIQDRGYLTMCRAIVRTDYSYCKKGKDGTTFRALCDYSYIKSVCKESPEEMRDLCYAEGAITVGSAQGCIQIMDDDLEQDCFARVNKDPAHCEAIIDTELKAQCLAMVTDDKQAMSDIVEEGSGTENTEEPEAGGGGIFGTGGLFSGDRFSSQKAKTYCNDFSSLTSVYPVIKTIGAGDAMTCVYGDEKDRENDAYTYKIMLYVREYANEVEATSKWTEVNGPDAVWLDLVLYKDDIIAQNHTSTEYYYQERLNYSAQGEDVTEYRLYAGQLVGRYRIEYTELSVNDEGGGRWTTTLEQVKRIILK